MTIRMVRKSEFPRCASLVKDAFRDYGLFELPGTSYARKKRFFNSMMDVWTRNAFRHGVVLAGTASDEIVSVAALQRPGGREIAFSDASMACLRMFLAGGIRATNAFLEMCRASDAACHALPDPKWHLAFIAVSPSSKGQGLGSAMLRNGVVPYVAQHGGGLLTLNTNTEPNRRFYAKNGFTEFDADTLQDHGRSIGNWSYKMKVDATA